MKQRKSLLIKSLRELNNPIKTSMDICVKAQEAYNFKEIDKAKEMTDIALILGPENLMAKVQTIKFSNCKQKLNKYLKIKEDLINKNEPSVESLVYLENEIIEQYILKRNYKNAIEAIIKIIDYDKDINKYKKLLAHCYVMTNSKERLDSLLLENDEIGFQMHKVAYVLMYDQPINYRKAFKNFFSQFPNLEEGNALQWIDIWAVTPNNNDMHRYDFGREGTLDELFQMQWLYKEVLPSLLEHFIINYYKFVKCK